MQDDFQTLPFMKKHRNRNVIKIRNIKYSKINLYKHFSKEIIEKKSFSSGELCFSEFRAKEQIHERKKAKHN